MAADVSDWIAAAGVRAVVDDEAGIPIPSDILADRDISLTAKGLYALLLAHQGQPVDPYQDPFESEADLQAAVEELLAAGLAVRVSQ